MLHLLTTIHNGFPASKQDLPKDIQEYHQYRDDMYTTDAVILYKDCTVIPVSLREDILKVVSTTFLLICFVCLIDSTFKTRKNTFYFVLEIIRF